jgi:hypothetical protein
LFIWSNEHGQGLDRPIYERGGGTTYHKFWDMAQRLLVESITTAWPKSPQFF